MLVADESRGKLLRGNLNCRWQPVLIVMANVALRLPENVAGDFFVDSKCIDCDACRQIAPEIFAEDDEYSIVYQQPQSAQETKRALMALVACPTGSIGTVEHHDAHIGIDAYPSLIAENVYFCGFTAESSFGAWSYLIVRPEKDGGNVLIDSPRFATQLVKKIQDLGGVRNCWRFRCLATLAVTQFCFTRTNSFSLVTI